MNIKRVLRNIKYILFLTILTMFLFGCKKEDSNDEIKKYSATATGYGGDVTVEVSITKTGKIGTFHVDAPKESRDKGQIAADKIAKEVIKEQSLFVDSVSGATITSTAILTAAEIALQEAGVDTKSLKK
jgi:uncharacterized protein with FMN-binding domain